MKNKLRNFFYYRYLKYFKKYIKLNSKPYISGDTFRSFSDHVYDELKKMDSKKVKKNDIVFVKTDFINEFLENDLDNINDFFILITHNSDLEINKTQLEKLDDKNLVWFAQNLSLLHSIEKRVKPLPIGLENRSYFKNGKLKDFKIKVPESDRKKNRIYCSFSTLTNDKRIDVMKIAKENPFIDFESFANHKRYIKNLSNYKFNVCPEGNGLDTHRIWESLCVKAVPIVENSNFIQNLKNEGVPLLILDNWNDLLDLNDTKLKNEYEKYYEILTKQNFLSSDYWFGLINSFKVL